MRWWLVEEREKARKFSTLPLERHPTEEDMVWIPRSVCHGMMRYGAMPMAECTVVVEDHFLELKGLV